MRRENIRQPHLSTIVIVILGSVFIMISTHSKEVHVVGNKGISRNLTYLQNY